MNEETPKRRPGRPSSVDRDALVRRGVALFVQHPQQVQPAMKVAKLARKLEVNASTFADHFGQGDRAGAPGRRAPVHGYFSALRDLVLAGDVGVERRLVHAFLQRYGCVFAGQSDAAIRRRLRAVQTAPEEVAVAEVGQAARGLGNVPNDTDRAVLALEVLTYARGLPAEDEPGELLKAELDAIDAFRVAAGDNWSWWRHYGLAQQLPAIEDSRMSYVVAGLQAESRARHGVALEDIRREVNGLGATTRAQAAYAVTVRLGAARGYADAGRLDAAMGAMADDPSDDMLLFTIDRIWHRAVVDNNDAAIAELQRLVRSRFDWWHQHVTDEEGNDLEEAPEFEDSGADEALALDADDGERLSRLSTLVSEQITSEQWRGWACAWSLPETVEVVVHYLKAAGRDRAARDLVADLLTATRWAASDSEPMTAADRAACQRLIASHPDAVEEATRSRSEMLRTTPVDTLVLSTRRLRHGAGAIPSGDFGRLLDAVIAGDVVLDAQDVDAVRQLGWLLDQRAARRF